MKRVLIVLLLGCGLTPLPPLPSLGCKEMKPICICDDMSNCEWQWICVRD